MDSANGDQGQRRGSTIVPQRVGQVALEECWTLVAVQAIVRPSALVVSMASPARSSEGSITRMSPAPVAVELAPVLGVQVQVNPAPASGAGSGSETVTPVALEGPALATVTFKLEHVNPGWAADLLAAVEVRYPIVPIVFCDTRPMAEEWTFRFLGAARALVRAYWDVELEEDRLLYRPHRPAIDRQAGRPTVPALDHLTGSGHTDVRGGVRPGGNSP